VADIELAVAHYWRSVQLSKDRIQALKDVILTEFEGRHDEGEQEVARQRKRLVLQPHAVTRRGVAA